MGRNEECLALVPGVIRLTELDMANWQEESDGIYLCNLYGNNLMVDARNGKISLRLGLFATRENPSLLNNLRQAIAKQHERKKSPAKSLIVNNPIAFRRLRRAIQEKLQKFFGVHSVSI